MSKGQSLRALVSERLTAAAEEIFILVERTIAEYEEELSRSKEENQRKQQLLEEVCSQILRTDEAVQKVKREIEAPQITEAAGVQIKVEDNPQELCISLPWSEAAVTMETLWEDPGVVTETEWENPSIVTEMHREATDIDTETQWENPGFATETQWENPGVATETNDENTAFVTEMHRQDTVMEKDTDTPECFMEDAYNMEEDWTVPLNDGDDDGEDGGDLESFNEDESNDPGEKERLASEIISALLSKEEENSVSCPFCEKWFSYEDALKTHMQLHTGELPFPCAQCEKSFRTKPLLSKHVTIAHSQPRPFVCSFCKAAFTQVYGLKKHMYQHTGRRMYQCSYCEDSFKRKYHLDTHLKTKHPTEYWKPPPNKAKEQRWTFRKRV